MLHNTFGWVEEKRKIIDTNSYVSVGFQVFWTEQTWPELALSVKNGISELISVMLKAHFFIIIYNEYF